jgi:hypothetical protein
VEHVRFEFCKAEAESNCSARYDFTELTNGLIMIGDGFQERMV